MSLATKLDQIFVLLQHWIAGFFPVWLQPFVAVILGVIGIVAAFPGIFAVTTVLERKGLGPYRGSQFNEPPGRGQRLVV